MYKTHTCGELRVEDEGKIVKLAGWVHRRRDHGSVTFIDLRDRFGYVQIVTDHDTPLPVQKNLESTRSEWVIQVTGKVQRRPEGMVNILLV